MNAVTELSFGLRRRNGNNWSPITDYEALVDKLADDMEQPHLGYRDASDLRALTTAEVSTVMRAHPQEVTDALEWDSSGDAEYLDRPLVLAAQIQNRYEQAARQVLILDVQDEISRRAEFEQWETQS